MDGGEDVGEREGKIEGAGGGWFGWTGEELGDSQAALVGSRWNLTFDKTKTYI